MKNFFRGCLVVFMMVVCVLGVVDIVRIILTIGR